LSISALQKGCETYTTPNCLSDLFTQYIYNALKLNFIIKTFPLPTTLIIQSSTFCIFTYVKTSINYAQL